MDSIHSDPQLHHTVSRRPKTPRKHPIAVWAGASCKLPQATPCYLQQPSATVRLQHRRSRWPSKWILRHQAGTQFTPCRGTAHALRYNQQAPRNPHQKDRIAVRMPDKQNHLASSEHRWVRAWASLPHLSRKSVKAQDRSAVLHEANVPAAFPRHDEKY